MLLRLLSLLPPRGGCVGERVHIWPDLSIAWIWGAERGIFLTHAQAQAQVLEIRITAPQGVGGYSPRTMRFAHSRPQAWGHAHFHSGVGDGRRGRVQ